MLCKTGQTSYNTTGALPVYSEVPHIMKMTTHTMMTGSRESDCFNFLSFDW